MRVVVFSTDRKILEPASAAHERQRAYAAHFDAYMVLVYRVHEVSKEAQWGPDSFAAPFTWRRATRAVRAADVISAQDPFETGLLAYVFALIFGKPLHMQVHTDFYAPGFARGHVLNRARRFVAPFMLRRAQRIRVVSEAVKESIEKRIAPKVPITVLPIFVDTARLQNIQRIKHPQWKIALLVVSRLEKEKNVALAIDALKAARDAGHDAGLTVVGSGSEEKALKAQARSLGLERSVVFTGWEDPVPAARYASADAVLVPSSYEGYGMVIIEALAAGIPTIATDVGIAREAGAIVAKAKDFPQTVVHWIESGPRQATLASYPYSSFEEYAHLYCEDLQKTAKS